MPATVQEAQNYEIVESFIANYWTTDRNNVLEFEAKLMSLISENDAMTILSQMQNYMLATVKSNPQNKHLFYKLTADIKHIEDAKRQISLTPAMNIQTVAENLCFKMILQ